MRVTTQEAADAYWQLLEEMQQRYMPDLRALERAVEEFKQPSLRKVCLGTSHDACVALGGQKRRHKAFSCRIRKQLGTRQQECW